MKLQSMPGISFVRSKAKTLKPIWNALSSKRKKQLLALQALSLIAACGEVVNLGALMPFLKLISNPQLTVLELGPLKTPLSFLPKQNLLLVLGLSFIAVIAASSALRIFTIKKQVMLTALIGSDIGDQVFASVLEQPYSWHIDNNSSSTLGYLTKDIEQVISSVQSILIVIVNLSILIVLGISLIWISPLIMVSAITLLSLLYLIIFSITRTSLKKEGLRLTENYQKSLQIAQEGLGGIRDIILDHTQSYFLKSYKIRNLNFRLSAASINIHAQAPRYIVEGFAVILVVVASTFLALTGKGIEQQLPLLGTLALGSYKLLQPLQLCFNGLSGVQANQASLCRLKPFLDNKKQVFLESTSRDKDFVLNEKEKIPLIIAKNIGFKYKHDLNYVLKNIDLVIRKGERIGFVGSTGSGKSTCCDILLGLLKPTEGELLINGCNLHKYASSLSMWQEKISHVPQQIYLSDASFTENIAFGVPNDLIDYPKVYKSAEQAKIAELIEMNPDGYSGFVGERGIRLSGGQRQRIGIARALYKNATLLVLDEATSALDSITESEVMESIDSLRKDLTIVIIAHRLSTVRNCDRIVVLEKGEIKATGTYDQLKSDNIGFQLLVNSNT